MFGHGTHSRPSTSESRTHQRWLCTGEVEPSALTLRDQGQTLGSLACVCFRRHSTACRWHPQQQLFGTPAGVRLQSRESVGESFSGKRSSRLTRDMLLVRRARETLWVAAYQMPPQCVGSPEVRGLSPHHAPQAARAMAAQQVHCIGQPPPDCRPCCSPQWFLRWLC